MLCWRKAAMLLDVSSRSGDSGGPISPPKCCPVRGEGSTGIQSHYWKRGPMASSARSNSASARRSLLLQLVDSVAPRALLVRRGKADIADGTLGVVALRRDPDRVHLFGQKRSEASPAYERIEAKGSYRHGANAVDQDTRLRLSAAVRVALTARAMHFCGIHRSSH